MEEWSMWFESLNLEKSDIWKYGAWAYVQKEYVQKEYGSGGKSGTKKLSLWWTRSSLSTAMEKGLM